MWPGPVVPFLLRKLSVGELDAYVEHHGGTLQARWQCQADFYVGLRALRERQDAVFKERMARSAASPRNHPTTYLESEQFLARWEVQRGLVLG
jgi:hypothetical protein